MARSDYMQDIRPPKKAMNRMNTQQYEVGAQVAFKPQTQPKSLKQALSPPQQPQKDSINWWTLWALMVPVIYTLSYITTPIIESPFKNFGVVVGMALVLRWWLGRRFM